MFEFETMWHDHPGLINAAKHRIELSPASTKPIYSAPYHAGPKTREFEKNDIQNYYLKELLSPLRRKYAAQGVFLPKKDGSKRFFIYYWKLNAVTKWQKWKDSNKTQLLWLPLKQEKLFLTVWEMITFSTTKTGDLFMNSYCLNQSFHLISWLLSIPKCQTKFSSLMGASASMLKM